MSLEAPAAGIAEHIRIPLSALVIVCQRRGERGSGCFKLAEAAKRKDNLSSASHSMPNNLKASQQEMKQELEIEARRLVRRDYD